MKIVKRVKLFEHRKFYTHCKKLKFAIKDFFSKCDQIRRTLDMVVFTEEIINGKLHFMCSESINISPSSYV